MPDRVQFGLCLGAQAMCQRRRVLQDGNARAPHDDVSGYDFQHAALRDLPFDFSCAGLGPPGLFDWCEYAEAMFPDASFLDGIFWQEREPWNFEQIGAREIVGCRMADGHVSTKLVVTEDRVECAAGDDPNAPGVSLAGDIEFSDVDGDGTLDAVMTLADRGVIRTIALTRKEGASGFSHARPREPSFDCKAAATPTEKRICSEGSLAGLDAEMGRLFDLLVGKLDDTQAEQRVRAEQRAFLRARDRGCTPDAGEAALSCLTARYRERIEALHREAWEGRCRMFAADPCSESLPLPHRMHRGR